MALPCQGNPGGISDYRIGDLGAGHGLEREQTPDDGGGDKIAGCAPKCVRRLSDSFNISGVYTNVISRAAELS